MKLAKKCLLKVEQNGEMFRMKEVLKLFSNTSLQTALPIVLTI